jgi:hypothetical protein
MSTKIPNPAPHKTIFRADFVAGLDYVTLFTTAATQIKGYPTWEVEGGRVTLRDPANRRSAGLDVGIILYEQDSGNQDCELKSLDEILAIWPKALGIKEYRRLGLRKKFLLQEEGAFEQLVALLNSRAFRLEELGRFLPKIGDSMMRFDCVEEPYRFHMTVAPVRRNEIFAAMEFNRTHLDPQKVGKDAQKINDEYPATAIFVDLDFYQSGVNIKAEAVNQFLIAGRKRLDEIAQNWAKFLFGLEK